MLNDIHKYTRNMNNVINIHKHIHIDTDTDIDINIDVDLHNIYIHINKKETDNRAEHNAALQDTDIRQNMTISRMQT